MLILLTIVHVLVCLFLIIVVLLQSGKAADIAGAFGGMGSQTTFGPRAAATVLTKATTASAILFMVTSLGLSVLATRNAGSGGGSAVGSALEKSSTAPAKGGAAPSTLPPKPTDPNSVNLDFNQQKGSQPQGGQPQQQPAPAAPAQKK
ncbi:MAG: preprotein translocase subunit SecG [Acidobacteria bacterium]|nr:preprotein translocase subunit SecG [Acidobacteriota bacterium]